MAARGECDVVASSSTYTAGSPRSAARAATPRARHGAAGTRPRLRWDRLGRLALLCVLAILLYLYVSAGAKLFSSWSQSKHDAARVRALTVEHRLLSQARASSASQSSVEAQARRLGMIKPGEQPYVITGLPGN
jgi:hypothetical protein